MPKKHTVNTDKALDVLVPYILNGGGCRGAYDELAQSGIKVSKSYSYDLFKMASSHIKETFHNSWEENFEYIKGEYQRLLAEATYTEDRNLQRQVLRDLMKLMGLEEKKVSHKFEADENSLEAFKKLFE